MPRIQYPEVPPAQRKLARGGTLCQCGREKDRRSKHCKECCPGPPKHEPDRKTDAEMLALKKSGMTLRAIALKYGVSFERVRQRIARARQNGA